MREPNLRDDLLTKALPFCENLWNVSIRNEPREFSKFHCGGVRIVFICIHALVISNTDVKGKFILFLLWWFSFLDFWRIFVEFEDKFFIENCRISFFSFNRIWRILFEIVTAMVESLFKFYPGGRKIIFSFNFKRFETDFETLFFPFLIEIWHSEKGISI